MRAAFILDVEDISAVMVCLSECAGRAEVDGDFARALQLENITATMCDEMMPVISVGDL